MVATEGTRREKEASHWEAGREQGKVGRKQEHKEQSAGKMDRSATYDPGWKDVNRSQMVCWDWADQGKRADVDEAVLSVECRNGARPLQRSWIGRKVKRPALRLMVCTERTDAARRTSSLDDDGARTSRLVGVGVEEGPCSTSKGPFWSAWQAQQPHFDGLGSSSAKLKFHQSKILDGHTHLAVSVFAL